MSSDFYACNVEILVLVSVSLLVSAFMSAGVRKMPYINDAEITTEPALTAKEAAPILKVHPSTLSEDG
jgi:hypothetical protein